MEDMSKELVKEKTDTVKTETSSTTRTIGEAPYIEVKDAVRIDINLIHANAWNPNEQTDQTFIELVERIKEQGFKDPISVVRCNCELIKPYHYKVIGGEHRWKAGVVLDMKELPCFVEEDWDEVKQKLETVRDNVLRGKLNDIKFTELVNSLKTRIDEKELMRMMGFTDQKEFLKHYIAEKSERDKKFLDAIMDVTKKGKGAVEGLVDIISNIFAESGATIDQNFVFFTFKGKLQLAVFCDGDTMKSIEAMVEQVKVSGDKITDFLINAINKQLGRTVEVKRKEVRLDTKTGRPIERIEIPKSEIPEHVGMDISKVSTGTIGEIPSEDLPDDFTNDDLELRK